MINNTIDEEQIAKKEENSIQVLDPESSGKHLKERAQEISQSDIMNSNIF